MKNVFIIFSLILLTMPCFARIPSAQEAQRHIDLKYTEAAFDAERLQTEAGRRHLNNYYFVKLTKGPKSAVPLYDKKDKDSNVAFYDSEKSLPAVGDIQRYISVNCDKDAYIKEHGTTNYERALNAISYVLAERYVRTHILASTNELICYLYSYEITLYEQNGVTGQTRVYRTYSDALSYNPYTDEFGTGANFRQMSMDKTIKYIQQVYTARELIEIFGLKEPIKDALRKLHYNEAIIEILNRNVLSAGPILPHNSEREDKYNKAMFGDMSAQIQRLPSSSINQPKYPDGGDSGINAYVKRYIKYSASLQQDGMNESAEYVLTIDKNGIVKDVVTDNYKFNSDLRNQTIKLLKNLPKRFIPASGYGQNIESTYRVRIDYELTPAIQLDKKSISFPYSQKEEKIKVTARKEWTFTQPKNSSLSVRRDGKYLVFSCKNRNERDYDVINDKIIVSTTDNSASYTINISQAGAPRPFIKLEKDKVVIPRDGTPQTITVNSNRTWFVTNTYANSKFTINASSSYLTIEAKKNLSIKGRSVTYGLKTQDGEYSTSLEVYQNGRGDESYGTSGYGRTYENYYERNGKYGLAWANIHLGVGAIVPSFDELYIPVNVEAFTSRLYMVELSLINVRADFSLDGFDGLAWEPHVKFLLPINEKLAIMPYVGPTCQLDIYNIRNSTWNFSAGAVVRYSWGRLAFSDFSIDYHGGPLGGISMGISLGFTSDYAN